RAGRAAPGYLMKTLTFTGTNLAGKPDTGDLVIIVNVDDSSRLDGGYSLADFSHGIAKFSVPAGHYLPIGVFFGSSSAGAPFPVRHGLDVLPQFAVTGNTTVRVAARAADSKVTMVTPRPAAVRDTSFEIFRTPRSGPAESLEFVNFGWLGGNAPIWVSPTS